MCSDVLWSSAATAAPAPGRLAAAIPRPAQANRAPRALRRLTEDQRLLRLQLVGHGHKNGLHVVTVPVVPVPLTVGVLGRRLEKRHGVRVRELLRHVRAHLHRVLQVALVPHQDPGDLCAQRVLLALLDPGGEAAEAGGVGHVVDEDDGVHVAVIVLDHGLPEALLACSVPQLDLEGGT